MKCQVAPESVATSQASITSILMALKDSEKIAQELLFPICLRREAKRLLNRAMRILSSSGVILRMSVLTYPNLLQNYNVPKGPKKDEDQVIYWWLGVEPPSASDVLQPVLGWNGFGGPRWTFASWNCCPAGHTHYATPLNVSTGDNLYGALDSTGGDGYTVVSEFADHKGKASILKSDDELPQNAPLLSLETYNIVQDCALLPESEMEITSLAVSPKVSWDPDTPQGWALTSCGWKVGINGNNLVASPPTAHPVAEDVII